MPIPVPMMEVEVSQQFRLKSTDRRATGQSQSVWCFADPLCPGALWDVVSEVEMDGDGGWTPMVHRCSPWRWLLEGTPQRAPHRAPQVKQDGIHGGNRSCNKDTTGFNCQGTLCNYHLPGLPGTCLWVQYPWVLHCVAQKSIFPTRWGWRSYNESFPPGQ